MGDCCNCHSEISRDGSGQLSRFLKALDPDYAPIDDRNIANLLVFTKRYANQVRFYDIPGSNPGNETDTTKISWREFFRRDLAVIAASISLTDTWQIKKDYDELRTKLDAHPSYNTFDDLFDPILGLAVKIDKWYSLAIPENPLYADLQLAISSNLKGQMKNIIGYEKGFSYVDSHHPLHLDYSAIENKDLWGLNDTINPDISIYQGADAPEKISNAALYIDDIFNNFYGFISQLISDSERYMQFALHQYPAHQPHMALFIAFLQLFRLAQDQMNGITQRMLDFYYRDVLHLTAKSSIPDKVHIVFELAKDITEYDVAQGTSLKAGKDALGNDQIYATESDLVVNQAKVKEIKNILVEKKSVEEINNGVKTTKQFIQNIYARSVANSKDGLGEKFTEANSKWPTFGQASAVSYVSNNMCDRVNLPDNTNRQDQANIGFAIASPQLVLQGGKRLVEIKGLDQLIAAVQNNPSPFEIWLTGEKGWLKIDQIMTADDYKTLTKYIELGAGIFNPESKLPTSYHISEDKISIFLPISEKAICPFDSQIHPGLDFITTSPVVKILINSELNIDQDQYNSLVIDNLSLTTRVGSINPPLAFILEKKGDPDFPTSLFNYHFDGLKTLVLQNDLGLIPPDQPFDPFTPFPTKNKSFYIGSAEVFNKNFNDSCGLAINLEKVSGTNEDANTYIRSEGDVPNDTAYKVSVLQDREWTYVARDIPPREFTQWSLSQNILHVLKTDSTTPILVPLETQRRPIENVEKWTNTTEKGFIKLENLFVPPQSDIVLRGFQLSQDTAIELQIKQVCINYYSELTSLDPDIDQFFHIYPFGVVETYLTTPASMSRSARPNVKQATDFPTLDKAKDYLLVDAGNAMLPQFNYLDPYAKYYPDKLTLSAATTVRALRSLSGRSFSAGAIRNLRTNAKSSNAVRLLLDARESAENTANQYSGNVQEGTLYIGLENLKPLQSISMLFQFAEGSAEDEDNDPPKQINWSYLTYNEWRPLKAESISFDGTYGFQTTGILKMDIPADATTHNTIMTDGLLWLSASVGGDTNRIPQLIDIVTQAVEAKFNDQNNDPSHFDNALPAGSISKLSTPVAQVSKVQQPFASFDGKHAEIGKEFYTRVSERLRHKGRAITAWDYEHLVLDRFPSIYKVKCITHTDPNCLCTSKSLAVVNSVLPRILLFTGDHASIQATLNMVAEEVNKNPLLNITLIGHGLHGADNVQKVIVGYATGVVPTSPPINLITKIDLNRINSKIIEDGDATAVDIFETEDCCGPQIAPGHVLLIPIANLKNRNAVNPLQPKTSRRTLIAIQEYLRTRTSPFVHVHAKNPVYEQIIVSFKVKFYSGTDKGYYMKKLNDEIVRFLTPWAFDENAEVKFNQKIYASSIINFIEERSYVDFITDFIMGVCCNECCTPLETAGIGVVNGTVFDNENDKKPLGDIVIKLKETNKVVRAAADGKYTISNIPPGKYTLVAYFSLFNIEKQNFTIDDDGVATPATIDFYEGRGNRQEDVIEYLAQFCGCDSMEGFLKYDPNFKGDIVAKPCTSRSLLVSAPQHVIIPYEEDTEPCPCEKAQSGSGIAKKTIAGIKASVPAIKDTTEESKKAREVSPAKPSSTHVKEIKASRPKHGSKPKKPK